MPNSEPTKSNEKCCGSCEWWFPTVATVLAAEGLCNCAKGDRDQTDEHDSCEHWEALTAPAGPGFGIVGARSADRSFRRKRRVSIGDHLDNSENRMRPKGGADR